MLDNEVSYYAEFLSEHVKIQKSNPFLPALFKTLLPSSHAVQSALFFHFLFLQRRTCFVFSFLGRIRIEYNWQLHPCAQNEIFIENSFPLEINHCLGCSLLFPFFPTKEFIKSTLNLRYNWVFYQSVKTFYYNCRYFLREQPFS